MVVSCGGSGEKGWRTELQLGSGESLDERHGTAASRTEPERDGGLDLGGVCFGLQWRYCTQELEAQRQKSGAVAIGQKAEVADADEAFGEYVQQEATQELVEREGEQLLFIVVSGIPPAKNDLAIAEGDETMVGDGYAMGVAAQILQHIVGATEGGLEIDHPVLSVEWP